MVYDSDIDEAQTQLHHQQLKNDERASMDRRRSHTRQNLLNQVAQNGNLMREQANLEVRNKELEKRIAVLEGQIEGLTELAKTKLYQGAALRTTIKYLRDAWATDNPNSAKRLEIEASMEKRFTETLKEHSGAPDIINQVFAYINKAMTHVKTARR
ncbi:hypothetical protein [Xanthomonas cannabis]|uniref:hypothetical protein n=1 Tax=Xanthomonas cannabis TaxID=1885674 RepID=UPI00130105E3|nr:hypothetical protein [Xanthomonas cannabis]